MELTKDGRSAIEILFRTRIFPPGIMNFMSREKIMPGTGAKNLSFKYQYSLRSGLPGGSWAYYFLLSSFYSFLLSGISVKEIYVRKSFDSKKNRRWKKNVTGSQEICTMTSEVVLQKLPSSARWQKHNCNKKMK